MTTEAALPPPLTPITRTPLLGVLLANALTLAAAFTWVVYMISTNSWGVFVDGWPMALTAVLGSFVAGCSPLGGGAAAYPVLVLVINVVSKEARIFSMMQQSVGMSAASWRIAFTATHHIDYFLLGAMVLLGIIGFDIGYYLLEIPGPYVQTIYFTSTVVLGVIVQLFLNHIYFGEERTRSVVLARSDVPAFVVVMLLGGILFSYVGTGADVLMYIYLRFAKNVDEVVATNYSIFLATALSLFGFFNEAVIARMVISARLWRFFLCVVPVVSLFAPLGSYVTNRVFSRSVLNVVIYALEILQFTAGFAITIYKSAALVAISLSMVGASIVYMGIAYAIRIRTKDRANSAALPENQLEGVAGLQETASGSSNP